MVDDQDLAGLDPYDLMAIEAGAPRCVLLRARAPPTGTSRLAARGGTRVRCSRTSPRREDYNQACLDGTVQEFLADVGAKGAIDLASANEIGIHEFDGQTPEQILETWRTHSAAEP